MSKKPDNENAPVNLGRMGGWVDFDETEQSAQTDPAATLAFLNAAEGVNFWREFVKQYAAQQNYSDERTRLLEDKAHEAIKRYEQGLEGARLRLVSHIDGLPIDDPVKRQREAFWMLTNPDEFNAFLEAVGEPARWHDPSKPAPKPDPETLSRENWPPWIRKNEFSEAIDDAIAATVQQNGWSNTTASSVLGQLVQMVEDATTPPFPFNGNRIDHSRTPIEFHYDKNDGASATIKSTDLRKRVQNRLNIIRKSRA